MTQHDDRKLVLFCDYDGTITMSDNVVAVLQHFDPPGWVDLIKELVDGRKSLRTAVGEMFALFPSAMKSEIQQYVLTNAQIRPGFQHFLQWCKQEQIDYYVTSGGIDFILHPILAPFQIQPERIYCNGSSFDGERIEILWPHPCDEHCTKDCGMCKTRIIRRFPPDQYYRVLIGDSLTDFEGAKLVDHVFARSHLLTQCKQTGTSHTPFETFYDVINGLKQLVKK